MENENVDFEIEEKSETIVNENDVETQPKKTKNGTRFRKVIAALLVFDLALFAAAPLYSIKNSKQLHKRKG